FAFALYNGLPGEDAIIGEVIAESAAEQAGLQAGDQVVAVDQKEIKGWSDFQVIISAHPEQEVPLSVLRDGQKQDIQVTPMSREAQTMEGELVYEGFIGVGPLTERSLIASIQYGFTRTYEVI